MAEASEHMWRAFSHMGTLTATCACGVTYFCVYNNEGDYNENELENLRQKASDNPKHFVELDCSGVSVIEFGDQHYVEGCACGGLKRYEDFIWRWRLEILDYVTRRLEHDQVAIDLVRSRLLRVKQTIAVSETQPAFPP